MKPIPQPQNVFKIFYGVTGIALGVVITGFGQCLFDMEQISACADHGEVAFDAFKAMGDHIINWFIALSTEVMSRH